MSCATKKTINNISGYTKHGLNQAISRNDGMGVDIEAINDAVKNPTEVKEQENSKKYIGEKATVILNNDGKVITTYGQPRNKNTK